MSCLYCDDPNPHPRNICGPCLLKQFGSPCDAGFNRAEAWRRKRDKKPSGSEIEPEQWVDGRWAK